ncbi:hypothetical protein [Dyadobacter sp. CY326]|uniref:hypothetical protein n=1 Tax=Dyadobacter sp. CY326 TaxID=2907300 RepID=UPI001F385968|nr:hypothetical protein [Dyadobacter sp. CY326]MCE7064601.1 hypothetical protein [Dyadobacter sp. CY326]
MKTVTLFNWLAIGVYSIGILATLLFAKTQSDRLMANGMLLMLYIPLAILAVLNYLPYKMTKIIAMVINIYPVAMGVFYLGLGKVIASYQSKSYDQEVRAQADGSFYFQDPLRRNLATHIAAGDIKQLKNALQQPIPNLNASGEDHVAMLDFTAMQAGKLSKQTVITMIQMLIDKGAEIETRDALRTPTQFLVLASDPDLLKVLLKNGADANAIEKERNYHILFLALYLDSTDHYKAEKVRLLLDHGADPNALSPKSEDVIVSSILAAAADAEEWEICNLLLKYGAKLDSVSKEGQNIRNAVDMHCQQFEDLDKMPPLELAFLKERLKNMR